jgi:hypothetical protein
MPATRDLALGAHEPLAPSPARATRKARATSGRTAAERAQRERDRASAASAGWQQVKHQPQAVVGDSLASSAPSPSASSSASSRLSDARRAATGRWRGCGACGDPRAGLRGTPSRPALERDSHDASCTALLGEVEVAEDTDQRGDRPARLVRGTGAKSYRRAGRAAT